MQLSLELEYWTVDETGALASASPILDRVDDLHAESADPLLEVVTDPCDDVSELRTEVSRRLQEAIAIGREENRRLVPLGTPLNSNPISTNEDPRTRIQRQILGSAFDYATQCAGTHLHVDQIDGAETDQLNLMTALDPAFALVASATYHQGDNVATCARSHVYRRMCYGDHPSLGRLWPYVEDVDEWEDRIDATFGRFRHRAVAQDVRPSTVDQHFVPEDSIWTPVRLRAEYDTIEWRAPDVTLPSQVLQLVANVRSILSLLHEKRVEIGSEPGITSSTVSIPTFDRLRRYVSTAIDHGIESPDIQRYLETMGFDMTAYRPISTELDENTPMTRQRAQRLRLRYADRLETDVETLTGTRPPIRAAVAQ